MTPAEFRAIRNRLGLTQLGLANMLKVREGQVNRIECGRSRPSPGLLELLRRIVLDAEK